MRRPASLLAIIVLGGCAWGGPGGFTNDPQMFADLAKDPNTACIYIAAVPPYFGGFTWIRSQPNASTTIECGGSKITPTTPAVIQVIPQAPSPTPATKSP